MDGWNYEAVSFTSLLEKGLDPFLFSLFYYMTLHACGIKRRRVARMADTVEDYTILGDTPCVT